MAARQGREGESRPVRAPAVSATDLSVLLGATFMVWPAWLLPERYWPALSRALGALGVSDLSRDLPATAVTIRRTLGARLPGLSGQHVLRELAAEGVFSFLQVLKSYRPDRWAPAVTLAEAGRIQTALRAGRGVVLWVVHAFHGHLAAKVALHNAGLQVSHLSRATHGFSESRFGTRYLNRLQTAIEDRHLFERILMPPQAVNAPLLLAARRLAANGIVSVTAQRGRGPAVAAPFLDGELHLAPGAPALARMTGATLLPVFAFREPGGGVKVTVEPAIALDPDSGQEDAVRRAVHDYARMLEPYALRYPGQWLGWTQL